MVLRDPGIPHPTIARVVGVEYVPGTCKQKSALRRRTPCLLRQVRSQVRNQVRKTGIKGLQRVYIGSLSDWMKSSRTSWECHHRNNA